MARKIQSPPMSSSSSLSRASTGTTTSSSSSRSNSRYRGEVVDLSKEEDEEKWHENTRQRPMKAKRTRGLLDQSFLSSKSLSLQSSGISHRYYYELLVTGGEACLPWRIRSEFEVKLRGNRREIDRSSPLLSGQFHFKFT